MGGVDQSDQLVRCSMAMLIDKPSGGKEYFSPCGSITSQCQHTVSMKKNSPKLEVAKVLFKGYTKHQPKHFTVSQDLPLRLTERPIPKRISSDCSYGGRLLCEVKFAELETSGHGHTIGARCAKLHCT